MKLARWNRILLHLFSVGFFESAKLAELVLFPVPPTNQSGIK